MEKLKKELESLYSKEKELSQKSFDIQLLLEMTYKNIMNIRTKMLFNSKILKRTNWGFEKKIQGFYLNLYSNECSNEYKELVSILGIMPPHDHIYFPTMKNITFHYNDGEIKIEFNNIEYGKKFIIDNNMNIDFRLLDNDIKDAKKTYTELLDIKNKMQLKNKRKGK